MVKVLQKKKSFFKMDETQGSSPFGIEEEELYNKCLFKQVCVKELESELKQRDIQIKLVDSYHILTLRLRLDILVRSHASPSVQEELKSEISAFYISHPECIKPKTYKCCLRGCRFEAKNHTSYVSHLQIHESISHKIVCQLKGCTRELTNLSMLRIHIKTFHRLPRTSLVNQKRSKFVEELVQLRCLQTECDHQKVSTVAKLKGHLKFHTDKRDLVQCPFAGCAYEANISSTLRNHMNLKHPQQQVDNLKADIITEVKNYEIYNPASNDAFEASYVNNGTWDNFEEAVDSDNDEDCEVDEEETLENEETFVKSLAVVFNNWMNVSGISYSTVNSIVSEVFRSYNKGVEVTKQRIKRLLTKQGLEEGDVEKIMETVGKDDPFNIAQEQLENEKKRIKFIKEAFENTPPSTIRLNSVNESKPETYQYVSIKSSLKNLLEDESYMHQKRTNPYKAEEGVVKDVRDGSNFRNNSYFVNNPDSVPLLLFQDELEVCNPIGSGKCKHKINVTYYTTLDVQSAYRSRVKSLQLVSLVLSKNWKKHGNAKCNAELVTDLLELESKGIEVHNPDKKVIKAALCYIVGDNLGLAQLGEFSACFSSGKICRVCHAEYKDVCQKHLLYANVEEDFQPDIFTEESYNSYADIAEENGEASSESMGIKGHCIFNKLQSFHCVTGMPPCLGHDFYEGAFSYDVQHLLDYIINKEKLISLETFNRKLQDFKMNRRDSNNRPNMFKTRKKNSKYEGSAGSLRVLSRIMTPLLHDVLEESKAGKILIKLAEVSEIITAPKLSCFELGVIMPDILNEYLDLRISAIEDLGMPNPRPKHHMLSHYSVNYVKYGPLIMLWGMRFESKHVYFKTVIKTAKNFKNVALTCASRHQLAQISYAFTGLFPRSKYEYPDDSVCARTVAVKDDRFLARYVLTLNKSALVLKNIKFFGTLYVTGNILVLKKMSPGTLKVGLLRAISIYEDRVNFGVEVFMVLQNRFNFYVTTSRVSVFEKVDYQDLQDYYPLQRYGPIDAFSFPLHHYVSEK